MTSVATDVGPAPVDDPDRMISATIRALVAARQADTGQLSAALGMSRSSYYNRVNGEKPWHARDAARAARFFGIPVGDLYEGRVTVTADAITHVCSSAEQATVIAFPPVGRFAETSGVDEHAATTATLPGPDQLAEITHWGSEDDTAA